MSTHIRILVGASTCAFLLTMGSVGFGFTRPRCTPRSYQRGTAAVAPAQTIAPRQPGAVATGPGVQSTRRYSFTPGPTTYSGGYSYSPPPALGTSRPYNPGRGYAPSRGINSADFKIKGL